MASPKKKAQKESDGRERRLYLGDNLKVLRDMPAESVHLTYLDPPFNSAANYNVLFKNQNDQQDAAQILAFTDTWHWGPDDEQLLFEMAQKNGELAQFLSETVTRLGRNDLSAYLVMMGARLIELHRVLKPKGALYLHCDPAASHYLKIMLDIVFEAKNFQNEIVWKRSSAHNDSKRWGGVHDVILFYSKGRDFTWNPVYTPYDDEYVAQFYRHNDNDGKGPYTLSDMAAPEGGGMAAINKVTGKPNGWYEWEGFEPPARGWRYKRETMQRLHDEGRIYYPSDKTKRPRLKRYLADMPGVPVQDVITDIGPLSPHAFERLGYPTQKPVALLERIISASSNPGDVVLDPFCGCGTTISASEKLGRSWIGIDITHLSIALIKARLKRDFDLDPVDYHEEGTPTTVEGAEYLFQQDAYQFQFWALGQIGAQPWGASAGNKKGKKGADGGIDGQMFFVRPDGGKVEKVIVSVKGGKNLTAGMVRDLAGVLTKEKAAIGVFLCLAPPTAGVVKEAAQQGGYEYGGRVFPRVQVLTVAEILAGKRPDIPAGSVNVSYEQKKVETKEMKAAKNGMEGLF